MPPDIIIPTPIILKIFGAQGPPGADGGTGGGGGGGETRLPVLGPLPGNPNSDPKVTAEAKAQIYLQGSGTGPYIWWQWDGYRWVTQDAAQAPVYNAPYFTSFVLNEYTNGAYVENGAPFTSAKVFNWSVNDKDKVVSPGLRISYQTPATPIDIIGNLPHTGPSASIIPASFWNGPIDNAGKAFRIHGKNTQGGDLTADFTIRGVLPWFWGKITPTPQSPGRPTAITQAQIDAARTAGNYALADSTGNIFANFQSQNTDYIWFAIPYSPSNVKTIWYQNAINAGPIGSVPVGSGPSPGGNLFPDSVTAPYNMTYISNTTYRVYISNYQTALTGCELRNS